MSCSIVWRWSEDKAAAVAHIANGNVLAYPTEAVFGLGADPQNPQAIAEIMALKQGRDADKGMVLLAADWDLCVGFVKDITPADMEKMQALSIARATTFIVNAGERVSEALKDTHTKRIAIRISKHPMAAGLSRALGYPIISTSANVSRQAPAKTVREVRAYFPDIAVLNGELGGELQPSRIIDWASGAVLRD